MKIELIEDTEAFRGLQAAWNALLEASSQFSVFLTWEWLFTWWTHFHEHKRLFVLLLKDESTSRLIAIAPWYLEEQRPLFFLPLQKVSFLGTGQVTSDFLDLIVLPGYAEPVVACISAYLVAQGRRWDLVEFGDIAERSETLPPLRSTAPARVRSLERVTDVCPYILLPAEHEDFLATLGPHMRRNLRKDIRFIESELQLHYTSTTDPEELSGKIDSMFTLHNERFNAKSSEATVISSFSGERIIAFHHDLAKRFLAHGWLKLFRFEHDHEPVAFLYAFRYQGRLFTYQSGFSSAWGKPGPVNILFHHAIQDSILSGSKEFHFLRGGEAYKAKWTKSSISLHTVLWINSSRNGRAFSMYLRWKDRIKTLLQRLGIRRTRVASPHEPFAASTGE